MGKPRECDVIIPCTSFSGNEFIERLATLQFSLDRFLSQLADVNVNVILVEQDIDPVAPRYRDSVTWPRGLAHDVASMKYEKFCKPWLLNIGANMARSENLFLLDMDCLALEVDFLQKCFSIIQSRDMKWGIAWDTLHYCGPIAKGKMIAGEAWGGASDASMKMQVDLRRHEGGIVYFNRGFYMDRIGGCNEFFVDLRGMDNELACRARYVSGQNTRCRGSIYHLWHPDSDMKSQPTRRSNKEILNYTEKNPAVANKVVLDCKKRGLMGGDRPACAAGTFFHGVTHQCL